MLSITKTPPNTPYSSVSNQINHSDEDGGSVAFPLTLTFRMPDGTRSAIDGFHASFTLKDLAKSLHERGGEYTCGFPPTELGRSFDFFFGGRSYPADSSLSSIYEEVNLNDQDVACMVTEAKLAADKLTSSSDRNWRVLNKNMVMLDSDPYGKQADAEAFAAAVLEKIPHLRPHIEMQIKRMTHYFYVEMRVQNMQSIRAIVEGIPIEIMRAGPLIAQALRSGNHAALASLPLDVLSRLGMFLAPEINDIDGFRIMQSEIDHASEAYHDAPVFNKIVPEAKSGIENAVAATANLLLRGETVNSSKPGNQSKVFNVKLSGAGMTLDFNDAAFARKFIRAMRHAGYHAAPLEWRNPTNGNGGCVARMQIADFNEVKRFVETTCGFSEVSTKELFKTASEELRIPSQFFVRELEAIGEWVEPMNLDDKKAAAKGLMQAYLPYLDRKQAGELKEAVWARSRDGEDGQPGALQYLREKRGAGRIFSIGNYSDDVATFREIIAAIYGLKELKN
jgi:hypothetical protein